jgi:predicted nucleotidyltransferase
MLHMEQISYKIIEKLQNKNHHIRALSKLIDINHMTIKRKIELLEKENVVDYTYEGKNKVYFLKETIESKEYQKIMENHKLIELIKKHPRIRIIVEKINKLDIDLAIIFGSYAKYLETEKSDIDLYINTTNKKLKQEIELIDSKLNIKIGKFNKESLLIKEIIKYHIIIKGVDKFYELVY